MNKREFIFRLVNITRLSPEFKTSLFIEARLIRRELQRLSILFNALKLIKVEKTLDLFNLALYFKVTLFTAGCENN